MLEYLKEIIKEAGYLAKGHYLEGISYGFKEGPSDFITDVDKVIDEFLVNKILEKYPSHGIISEERKEDINPDAEYVWVIDPIDGTRNFAKHIGFWCVMAGITRDGKPHMGAIYDALNNELFFAEVGKGAYLNGKQIHVNNTNNIEFSFVSFGAGCDKTGSKYDSDKYDRYKAFLNTFMGDTGTWIHNHGSILSTCHVAAGRMDAVISNSGLFHDYLAGYVIATEAGAKWTNSSGEAWRRGDKDVVIANPQIHSEIMKLMKKAEKRN